MSKIQAIFFYLLFVLAIFGEIDNYQLEQKLATLEALQPIINLNVESTGNLVKIVKLMDERIEKLEYIKPVEETKPATTDLTCVVTDMNPPTWSCAPPNLTPDNSILRQGLFQWELLPPKEKLDPKRESLADVAQAEHLPTCKPGDYFLWRDTKDFYRCKDGKIDKPDNEWPLVKEGLGLH